MKKLLQVLTLSFLPLLAVEEIDFCEEEQVTECQATSRPECYRYRCPNHYWYFDLHYEYRDDQNQEAYWPGKRESFLYDFMGG